MQDGEREQRLPCACVVLFSQRRHSPSSGVSREQSARTDFGRNPLSKRHLAQSGNIHVPFGTETITRVREELSIIDAWFPRTVVANRVRIQASASLLRGP